jgi:hypothetical protein
MQFDERRVHRPGVHNLMHGDNRPHTGTAQDRETRQQAGDPGATVEEHLVLDVNDRGASGDRGPCRPRECPGSEVEGPAYLYTIIVLERGATFLVGSDYDCSQSEIA